ncbi:hypothetical protein Glove_199g118 [Diversispora epigaea]|uniref:Uncharacterized protein n=1 Tax=Diversispora epigaea TaxID=1348612 RepID=A0A397IN40_9GLOM|nr:hypothetical protein Glove_199g118 [Diversispora epigaea]
MRDFHINEHRVDDIWEDRERQQQIIQSTISTEILPISVISPEHSNQIKNEVLLQSKPLGDSPNHSSPNLYLKSTIPSNTEIKKRSSKSRSKSIRISNPISNNSTKTISSENLDALYEKDARRDEKNITNMTRLLGT